MSMFFYEERGPKFQDMPIVTVYVGESKAVFQVHMGHLCDISPVLKATFTGNFKEAAAHTLDLPENNPETFEGFLQWLYTKKCAFSACNTEDDAHKRYIQLAYLYILADKLLVGEFQNYIVDRLFELRARTGYSPLPEVIEYVYANSTASSLLRKLLVSWCIHSPILSWFQQEGSGGFLAKVPEFSSDVAIALAGRVRALKNIPFDPSACEKSIYYVEPQYVHVILPRKPPSISQLKPPREKPDKGKSKCTAEDKGSQQGAREMSWIQRILSARASAPRESAGSGSVFLS